MENQISYNLQNPRKSPTVIITDFVAFLNCFALTMLIKFHVTFAANGDKVLTDLFDSEATRGSWNWFAKWNSLGMALNFIISFFCFISMFAIVLQTIITVSYFAIRPFWDHVHETKEANLNQNFFGFKGYFKDSWNAKYGSGIDALLNIFYAFLPDLYAKSEMADEKYGLTEQDSIGTWFVKTFPRKFLTILLLSMGFNGSLMKCYGVFVDAAGTFMSRATDYKLSNVVNKILDSGDNFVFSLGDDGTAAGKVQEGIARKIYSYALSKSGVVDASAKQQIGAAIQSRVKSEFNSGAMTQLLIANGQSQELQLSPEDWDYVHYTVTCNSSAVGGNGTWTLPLSEVVTMGSWNTENYVHVTPILKRKAPTHDYINS